MGKVGKRGENFFKLRKFEKITEKFYKSQHSSFGKKFAYNRPGKNIFDVFRKIFRSLGDRENLTYNIETSAQTLGVHFFIAHDSIWK